MPKHMNSQKILAKIDQDLSPTEKIFIRIFHHRVISTILDSLAIFPLRETPLLFGLLSSIIIGIGMISTAHVFAYGVASLQILIPVFLLGYLVGLIYEYLTALLRQSR